MKFLVLLFLFLSFFAYPQDQVDDSPSVDTMATPESSAEPSPAPEENLNSPDTSLEPGTQETTTEPSQETVNPETSSEPAPVIEATTEPAPSPTGSTPTLLVARGSGNIPPFEWENENGIQGIHIELVKIIGKRLGFDVQFETVPWKRALIKMQVKGADAITYVSKTADREEYIYFMEGNIISKTNVHFFTIDKTEKKEKMTFWKIRSIKDFKEWFSGVEPPAYEPMDLDRSIYNLKGNKIAVQKGYSYGDEFENIDGISKIFAGTIYDLKNYVLSGEAEIGLADIDYFTSLFKDEDFFKRVRFSKDPYYVSMNYIGFSKKPQNLEIAKKFSDELIAFKNTKEYFDLLAKFNIKNP